MKLNIPYHLENYIGGNLIGPLSGNFIDNFNPATGEIVGQIPESNEKDINIAVEAAKKAFPAWSVSPVEQRFRILNRIAELIEENLEELAIAETNDNGKPLWLAKEVQEHPLIFVFLQLALCILQRRVTIWKTRL